MTSPQVAKLARMIANLSSQVAKTGTAPQLPNSAIVDGTLDLVTLVDTGETDADGEPILTEVVQAQLGTQADGSQTLVVLEGPEPPAPAGGVVIAGPGSITAGWSGEFADNAAATLDHDYVAVHVAEKADVDGGAVVFPSNMTMMGTIRPLLGGQVTLARPAGVAYYVGLVSVTQAGKWSTLSDVLTVTPLDVAATGANGKPILWGTVAEMEAVTEPWVDGSTWFNADAGNAPNVWRDGAWVAATFNDGAIGNLNVAKLVGDTITGNFLVAGRFETALAGGVKMDAAGIRVYDIAGDLKTALNSDGASTFRGQIEASAVEVLGKLKFHGVDSEVAAGARLNITGGVTAPTTAPNVYPEWPTITLSGVPKSTIYGVTRDPANGDWIVASCNTTGTPTITRHAAATGALSATLGTMPAVSGSSYYPAQRGVAFCDGTAWVPYVVRTQSGTDYKTGIQIRSLDGTTKTILAAAFDYMWLLGGYCRLGTVSATQAVLYYYNHTTNSTRFCLYTTASSTKSGDVAFAFTNVESISYGAFDLGTNRFAADDGSSILLFDTTGAADTSNSFKTGRSVVGVGNGWYGGAWWTAHADGKCYIYDGPNVGSSGAEFAAAWYDSKTAGTGVHETPLSPSGWSDSGISRARLRVHPPLLTTTAGDDGVDSVRIYARVGGSMRLQGTLSTVDGTLLITGALASGTIHGSVANFPATSPGSIQNASGDIVLPGNGQAQLRGLNLPVSLTSETLDNLPHGLYLPSDAGLVTTARGYPLDGVLGMLEVVGYVTGSGLMQRYTTLEATPRVFTRALSGSWSAWVRTDQPAGMFRAEITASTAMAAGVATVTAWGATVNTFGAGTFASGVLTVPNAGYYAINAAIAFATQSTRRYFEVLVGSTIAQRFEGPATGYSGGSVSLDSYYLAAGAAVSVRTYGAAAPTITPSNGVASFSVRYIAPTP